MDSLQEDRKEIISNLRNIILKSLPKGFEEGIQYGMIGYFVPHSIYPDGYHCDPKIPLPFMSIAFQKNFVAVYHMGIYTKTELMDWFVSEFPKHSSKKLDMGKSCIRFKNMNDIPYDLIGELTSKLTPEEWISLYENAYKNRKK
ncbi:MAG: DUF1801 domain-containing protein [Flavobacteriaceae bacterium]|nr:DUF1801 domain-containing protein [Flavobacteriaceae bacterium]